MYSMTRSGEPMGVRSRDFTVGIFSYISLETARIDVTFVLGEHQDQTFSLTTNARRLKFRAKVGSWSVQIVPTVTPTPPPCRGPFSLP